MLTLYIGLIIALAGMGFMAICYGIIRAIYPTMQKNKWILDDWEEIA